METEDSTLVSSEDNPMTDSERKLATEDSSKVSSKDKMVADSENRTTTEDTTICSDSDREDEVMFLCNSKTTYKIDYCYGSGAFGHVFQCSTNAGSDKFAIKIINTQLGYRVERELCALEHLKNIDADEFNFVRAYEYFGFGNYACITFESLGISLEEYLKVTNYSPFALKHIRTILEQVANALLKFSELGLIHGDLKPANIVFVDQFEEYLRIKVIDFGNVLIKGNFLSTHYLQTRIYRAPEILLGMKFSEAIDIWSMGCIAAELYLGHPLYCGATEFHQLRYIIETQGLPPEFTFKAGLNKFNYFLLEEGFYRLKTIEEYEAETNEKRDDLRKYIFKNLDDMAHVNLSDKKPLTEYVHDIAYRKIFIEFLKRMLAFDQDKRITAAEAVAHPFITITYSENLNSHRKNHEFSNTEFLCHERIN